MSSTKHTGELITANLYQLEKGMNKAKVVDYYAENCPEVEILDVRLTPQQNAQKYFKQYAKAKTAEEVLTQQIEAGHSRAGLSGKCPRCSQRSRKRA